MALPLVHFGLAAVNAAKDLVLRVGRPAIAHSTAAGDALAYIALTDRNVVVFVL